MHLCFGPLVLTAKISDVECTASEAVGEKRLEHDTTSATRDDIFTVGDIG